MSGIDNPLKKLKRVPRSDYKKICQRIEEENDKVDKEKVEQRLPFIRDELKKAFEQYKACLLEDGGKDYFIFTYFTSSSMTESDSRFQKKLLNALTEELATTMSATITHDYGDNKGVDFKIPVVDN
jgi:hypothetical protein